MRSDYYDKVSQEPLRPFPRLRKKRKGGKKKIVLLVGAVLLLLAGIVWMAPRKEKLPPSASVPGQGAEHSDEKTTIQRLEPPGEGGVQIALEEGQPLDATEIYERVSPSVLTVTAMDRFGFGSEGTGVIFDESGYFVTNSHVIEGMDMVVATLSNGREYSAYLIGMDRQTDLAVLKLSAAPPVIPAVFGSDMGLKVGEPVYALGNPLGSRFSGSMTDGIISAINRNVWVEEYEMSLIQTTAALNQGNSGGALVDSRGRVVGITNLKIMSMSSTVEGLGFAIPTSTVADVVGKLMASGYVTGRPMLGITVRPAKLEESSRGGLFVEEVAEASDAWAKGLRKGHILLSANGNNLYANDNLLWEKEGAEAGDSLLLRWLDPATGEEREAPVALVEEYLLED